MNEHCFERIQKEIRSWLEDNVCPLMAFSGEVVEPLGFLTLLLTLRYGEKTRMVHLQFLVVRALSKYNIM